RLLRHLPAAHRRRPRAGTAGAPRGRGGRERGRGLMTTGSTRLAGARWVFLLLLTVLPLAAVLLSLGVGSIAISGADVVDALFRYNPESYEQTVVRTLRVPRTAIGLGVGAALAVAGAAMQAATRNP